MDFLLQAALLGALVVTIVQQILKLKIIPVEFANNYPVPTNIMLSIIVAVFAGSMLGVEWSWANWQVVAMQIALTAVGAAIAFNQLLAGWEQLRELEGTGKKK